jgi:hypothetical protein
MPRQSAYKPYNTPCTEGSTSRRNYVPMQIACNMEIEQEFHGKILVKLR